MVDALVLHKDALTLWQREHGSESLDQQCQRYNGYYVQWAYQGNESGIRTYGTAKAAALASAIQGKSINSAPVGSFLYWAIGSEWHVGIVIGYDGGRALVCYATKGGDTVLTLSHGVKVSHADTYSQSTFYGWSYTNGANPPLQNITPWNMAPARNADDVRRVAAYLNSRGLGRTTSAVIDGIPGENMYWMIQTAGTNDGIYNGDIDGETGPKTEAAFDHYTVSTKGTIPAEPTPPTPIPEPTPKTWMDGIDISGYQEGLDLSKVEHDFVIVKATEGTTFISTETHKFMEQAIALGKKAGIYHFATVGDAKEQADWFVKNASRYAGKAIPVLDFEGAALAQGASWALAWLARVEAAWGAKPIFYTQGSEASKPQYSILVDAGYLLWRAAYWENDPGGYELAPLDPMIDKGVWPIVTIRQYHSTGRLPGWSGNLDLNIFYGLAADWEALAKTVPTVEPEPDPEPEPIPEPAPVEPDPTPKPNWIVELLKGLLDLLKNIIGKR